MSLADFAVFGANAAAMTDFIRLESNWERVPYKTSLENVPKKGAIKQILLKLYNHPKRESLLNSFVLFEGPP